MQQPISKSRGVLRLSLASAVLLVPSIGTAQITEIIDATGDGMGNGLDTPTDVTVDGSGNAFVAGLSSLNAFTIVPAGSVAEIIDDSVGWLGAPTPAGPRHIAVDPSGDAYVASAFQVFKITDPGGAATAGSVLTSTTLSVSSITAFAADDSGAIYVGSNSPDSVFKVTDPGQPTQAISTIIGPMGDGMGNLMQDAQGIAIDATGAVYVAAARNGQPLDDVVFMITSGGTVTKILDATGDGMGNPLQSPRGIAVDASGNNVYVTGSSSNNVFRISDPGGANTITEILNDDAHPVDGPEGVAVDGSGSVYVACSTSSNAFKITPGGVIKEIIDATGDGLGNTMLASNAIAVDSAGNVYVNAIASANAFEIEPPGTPFCHGTSGCPCGNNDPGGLAGCENSSGSGAELDGCGSTSVTSDDLTLIVSNIPSPNANGIFFHGPNIVPPFTPNGAAGNACTGGGFRYAGILDDNMAPNVMTMTGMVGASNAGGVPIASGQTVHFQAWTRDSNGSPCPAAQSNLSNAYSVTFTP